MANRKAKPLLPALAVTFLLFCSCSRETSTPEAGAPVVGEQAEAPADVRPEKRGSSVAYIVSDTRIPFWAIMERGVASSAVDKGYDLTVYSSENSAKREIESAVPGFQPVWERLRQGAELHRRDFDVNWWDPRANLHFSPGVYCGRRIAASRRACRKSCSST